MIESSELSTTKEKSPLSAVSATSKNFDRDKESPDDTSTYKDSVGKEFLRVYNSACDCHGIWF